MKKNNNTKTTKTNRTAKKGVKATKPEATISIRGLFREMSTRKNGVTIAELRKEAAKRGINLKKSKVAATDSRLRTHVVWYAINNLDWDVTIQEHEGKETRYWGKAPKAKAA